ncbi:hypothetical protein [Pseudomonas sp. CGJS7]|uniref:hypothetical protein n=1 Tax=Pseudomonas sp. CGJS7 TaxID=3109348 RepID=UPI00300A6CEE
MIIADEHASTRMRAGDGSDAAGASSRRALAGRRGARRGAMVLLVLAQVFATSACGAGKAMSEEAVEISATVRDANTRLDIEWSLHNRGQRSLLALVAPLKHNESASEQTIYVSRGEDGAVVFALRAFAADGAVATLDRIGAKPLAPGQRLQGKAHVALPLRSFEPYRSAVDIATPATVRVCIGVIDADARFPHSSRQADGGVATYHDPALVKLQRVVCSAPVRIEGRR